MTGHREGSGVRGECGHRDKQRIADTMRYLGGDLNRVQMSSGDRGSNGGIQRGGGKVRVL